MAQYIFIMMYVPQLINFHSVTCFTIQRYFIKDLKVKDFVDHFNLIIDDAAEKVGICTSSFKSVLKRENFRWPCQKVSESSCTYLISVHNLHLYVLCMLWIALPVTKSHILQIRNIEAAIRKRSRDLNATSPGKRARAKADIEELKRQKESIYAPYRKIWYT